MEDDSVTPYSELSKEELLELKADLEAKFEEEKGKGLKLALSDGYIHITKVLPPMRKEMDAASFFNGSRGIIGSILN